MSEAWPDNPRVNPQAMPPDPPPQPSDTAPAGGGRATYRIRAPDGNTYRITGPAGATDEQVKAQLLRRYPNAGKPAAQPSALGAAELVGSAAANIPLGLLVNTPADIYHRVQSIGTTHPGGRDQPVLEVQPGAAGRETARWIGEQIPDVVKRLGAAAIAKYQQLPADVRNYIGLTGDVAQFIGLGGIAKTATTAAGEALSDIGESFTQRALSRRPTLQQVEATARQQGVPEEKAVAEAIGFRTAENQPEAAKYAGPELRTTLTNNNAEVAAALARHDAGVPHTQKLSRRTIEEGRQAPNAVYDRFFSNVNTAALDPVDSAAIQNIIRGTRSTAAEAELQPWLRDLVGPQLTGQELQEHITELRMSGYRGLGSKSELDRNVARAKLQMSDQLEQHAGKNLRPNSGTDIAQLRRAREALARNYTVAAVRQGEWINLPKLQRIYGAAPQRMGGALQHAARFAEQQEVAPVIGRKIGAAGLSTTIRQGADPARHGLKGALTYLPRATGIPQRALRKGKGVLRVEGRRAAEAYFPGRDNSVFAPLPPTPGANLGARFQQATGGYTPPPAPPATPSALPSPNLSNMPPPPWGTSNQP